MSDNDGGGGSGGSDDGGIRVYGQIIDTPATPIPGGGGVARNVNDSPTSTLTKSHFMDDEPDSSPARKGGGGPSGASELLEAIARARAGTPDRQTPVTTAPTPRGGGREQKIHEGIHEEVAPNLARVEERGNVSPTNAVAKGVDPSPRPSPGPRKGRKSRYAGMDHSVSATPPRMPAGSANDRSGNQDTPTSRGGSTYARESPRSDNRKHGKKTSNRKSSSNRGGGNRGGGNRKQFNLSNYRQLTKEERRRLLREVKLVLGEESLFSGMNNDLDDDEEDDEMDSYHDDFDGMSRSLMEEVNSQYSMDYNRDDSSRAYTLNTMGTMESRTYCTNMDDGTTYTAYTTDTRDTGTMYTAAEDDTGTQFTGVTGASFEEEEARRRRHDRHRRSRLRDHDLDDSILSDIDEEELDPENFFSLTDACMNFCGGGGPEMEDAEEEERVRRWRERRGRRRREAADGSEFSMGAGESELCGGAGESEFSGAAGESEFSGAEGDDEESQIDWNKGRKELEERRARAKREKEQEEEGNTEGGIEETNNGRPVEEALSGQYEQYEATQEEHKMMEEVAATNGDEDELRVEAVIDILEADGEDSDDASYEAIIPKGRAGKSRGGRNENDGNRDCGDDHAAAAMESGLLTKSPSLELVSKNKDEPETTNGAEEDDPANEKASKSTSQAEGSKPGGGKLFSKGISLSKKERSRSPFVRAISSFSRKSKDGEGLKRDMSFESIKSEAKSVASTGSTKSESTSRSARSGSGSDKSSKSAKNAGGTVPAKRRNKRGWREYVEPNTGKKYYSNGAVTTWVRPANEDILPKFSPPRSAPGAPEGTDEGDTTLTPYVNESGRALDVDETPVVSNRSPTRPFRKDRLTQSAATARTEEKEGARSNAPTAEERAHEAAATDDGRLPPLGTDRSSQRKGGKLRIFSFYKGARGNNGEAADADKNETDDGPTRGTSTRWPSRSRRPDGKSKDVEGSPARWPSRGKGSNRAAADSAGGSDKSKDPDSPVQEPRSTSKRWPSRGRVRVPSMSKGRVTTGSKERNGGDSGAETTKAAGRVDPASPDRTEASAGSSLDSEGDASVPGSESPLATIVMCGADGSELDVSAYNLITHNAAKRNDNGKTATAWKQHVLSSHTDSAGHAATEADNVDESKKKKKKKKRGWREYTDPSSGKRYYSDGVTTTWNRPADFAPAGESSSPADASSNPTIVKSARDVRSEHSVKTERARTLTTKKKKKKRGWREYTDRNTGKKYYSDGVTTTWDRPAGFGP